MPSRSHVYGSSCRRFRSCTSELIDFSRPATNELSRVDIHELIGEALNIAKYYKRKKGKTIRTRFAESLPPIRIVRDPIVQVFLNLILNAMDATDEGGAIEISSQVRDGWIEIAVADEGHGISPEDQQRIFQPYFTTKETGTGLGLFVCRHILTSPTGRLELTSTGRGGTTFTVFLTDQEIESHNDVAAAEDATIVTLGSEQSQLESSSAGDGPSP